MSKIIALRLDEKKLKKIKNFCEKNDINQTKLITYLIDNFFKMQEELINE